MLLGSADRGRLREFCVRGSCAGSRGAPGLRLPNQLFVCCFVGRTAHRGAWAQCAVVKHSWKTAKSPLWLSKSCVFACLSSAPLCSHWQVTSLRFNISVCKTVTLEIIPVAAEERTPCKMWLPGGTGSTNSVSSPCGCESSLLCNHSCAWSLRERTHQRAELAQHQHKNAVCASEV